MEIKKLWINQPLPFQALILEKAKSTLHEGNIVNETNNEEEEHITNEFGRRWSENGDFIIAKLLRKKTIQYFVAKIINIWDDAKVEVAYLRTKDDGK